MLFAYRNVTSGTTHTIRAACWYEADGALGYMLAELERLGAIAPALAPAARLMRFRDEGAFKAWRDAAWALYLKHHDAA
jgi:hypothetical protein